MSGSIGQLAEQVLAEIKSQKLTKLAQHQVIREETAKPQMRTQLGAELMKLAETLRNTPEEDVSVEDLKRFIGSV